MADKQSREVPVKLGVDATDAIKALKAVQREAKKATAALKEYEDVKREITSCTEGDRCD